VDRTVPNPVINVTYTHWGAKEPNTEIMGQQCGGGNWSMSWGKAWGWQGAPCSKKAVFMCMKSGEPAATCLPAHPGGPPVSLPFCQPVALTAADRPPRPAPPAQGPASRASPASPPPTPT
jgi:hypothetical protein